MKNKVIFLTRILRNIREISARISLNTTMCTKCTRLPLNSYVRIPCDVNSGLRSLLKL